VRAVLDSPTFLGGVWQRSGEGLVDPGALALGLRRVALELGVQLFEGTRATGVTSEGAGVRVTTTGGSLTAGGVLLGTNAFTPLVPRLRRYTVPVYDYVVVTEPLDAEQRRSLGWEGGQGFSDLANLFHYYRMTADGRVLWGGYDAEYHFASRMGSELEDAPHLYRALVARFLATFPQLEGIRFSHRWAGAIDTCTRFSAFFAQDLGGRAVSVAGYTGLGVGAARFGAATALDLLDGRRTEATELAMVRSMPLPFPPEPIRWAGIELTKRASATADRTGRRGVWLSTLDRLGLGFDS
jgi:glycine/D-amino acid oxidase-like deaminating enzyme